jgi:Tol biopolymer transport system component
VPPGYLLFTRDSALIGAAFDPDRLELAGPPARAAEEMMVDRSGALQVAASHTGTLAHASAATAASRLVWVSRQGLEEPATTDARQYSQPRVAPDARRLVVAAGNDLWLLDLPRGTLGRLTPVDDAPGLTRGTFPVWTPDSRRIVATSSEGLRWYSADGSGTTGLFAGTSSADYPTSVSPDGRTLVLLRLSEKTSGDIYTMALSGDHAIRPMLTTPAWESGGQISPDGRWLAYVSNDSGQFEVYVRPFLGADRRQLVSTQGGTHPRWSRSGRELFYRLGQKMMAVDVSGASELAFSAPRLLFEGQYAFSTQTIANYDVSGDGSRFVMVKEDIRSGRLNVVLNWRAPAAPGGR